MSAVHYFKLCFNFEMLSFTSKVFPTGKSNLFVRRHEHNQFLAIFRGTLSNSWSLKIKGNFQYECGFAHYASFTHTTCLQFSRYITAISIDMLVTLIFSFWIKRVQFASMNSIFFQKIFFFEIDRGWFEKHGAENRFALGCLLMPTQQFEISSSWNKEGWPFNFFVELISP